jgi:hypothetical protein
VLSSCDGLLLLLQLVSKPTSTVKLNRKIHCLFFMFICRPYLSDDSSRQVGALLRRNGIAPTFLDEDNGHKVAP